MSEENKKVAEEAVEKVEEVATEKVKETNVEANVSKKEVVE